MMTFTLLQTWITNYCADTVEWCPVSPFLNYFICGTYELRESASDTTAKKIPQTRLGQVHLFSVTEFLQLSLHCTVDCSSGVLDCKWYSRSISDKIVFITANADGKIVLWTLEIGDGQPKTNPVAELKINTEHILLSVDWCTGFNMSDICVSDSAGNISIVRMNENLTLGILHKFKIHDSEAWTATFGFDDTENIYSGADDNLLKITDIRSGKLVSELREHAGGVTSVRFCHNKGHIFASGSYDETVKLWDTRATSKSLSTLNVGGGIWRIKWDPQDANHVLIAGMYSGCFWLNYDSSGDILKIECSLNEHSSISYGADISYLSPQKIENEFKYELCTEDYNGLRRFTTTCSFYDKKLCLCLI